MKTQTNRRTLLAAALAVAGVFGFTAPAFAGVHVCQNGGTLTVTAPSTLAGKGLLLQTDAESSGTWTTAANIVGAVPAAGGIYTVDLSALGIANGTPCRIASATIYERLDMLKMSSVQQYVDTGIKGKNVYGLRFGFYPTGKSGTDTSHFYSAVNCGKDNGTSTVANKGGFLVCIPGSDTELSRLRFYWRGSNNDKGTGKVKTNEINEYAFTNRVCTLDGVLQQSNLAAGAISTNEHNVFLGKCSYTTYSLYGCWSHVSFDDENGNKILDYVPVQRASDGKVGFWNRIGDGSFVTSSGSEDFTAGTPMDKSFETDVEGVYEFTPNRQIVCSVEDGAMTFTAPSGLANEKYYLLFDDADMGDDPADWAHQVEIESGKSVRLSSKGVKNGMFIRVAAANVYKPLDMLQMGDNNCWIDSGIKGTDVYGLRFGFYGTATSPAAFANVIGSSDGAGFNVGRNNTSSDSWYWCYRGVKDNAANPKRERPAVSTTAINEVAFTNRVFTIGDHTVTNANQTVVTLPIGSVATNDLTIVIGAQNVSTSRRPYNGWWSHVSFDDASGNKILDYIPVQRVSDAKVGFYDRASLSFVTSSGTGNFTAGTVTNDTPVIAVNAVSKAQKVTGIGGLIIMFR